VDQVEFDVTTAAKQLPIPLARAPAFVTAARHDGCITIHQVLAEVAHEGENCREIHFKVCDRWRRGLASGSLGTRTQIVEKDPPNPARFIAMRKKEIAIAPALEAGIRRRL